MTREAVISVHHLLKTFGSFHAVNDISFDVHRGEIFGFLGANGAGKTTAMKMLTGLWKPTPARPRWLVMMYSLRRKVSNAALAI